MVVVNSSGVVAEVTQLDHSEAEVGRQVTVAQINSPMALRYEKPMER
jgi:hypothetical protein